MKKGLLFILLLIIFPIWTFALNIETNSENILVYNLKNNEIIYKQNSDKNTKIASLTKIVTIIVALEHINDLNEKLILTEDVFKGLIEADASVANFNLGEEVTYEDLLYGAMLPSGADATNALAINIFKDESKFIDEMNLLMDKLKIKNTKFINTSGLDEEGQKATLEDFLKIVLYAFKNDEFIKIFKTKEYTTSNNRLKFKSTLLNLSQRHNLDTSFILGSKTGYTSEAGLCLVSYAKDKETEILLITTNSPVPEPYYPLNIIDAVNIYNYYFNNYSYQTVLSKNQVLTQINTKYAKNNKADLIYNKDNIKLFLPNKTNIKYNFIKDEYVSFKNNINKSVGTFELLIDNKPTFKGKLFLSEKPDFSVIKFIKINIIYIIIFIASITGLLIKKKVMKA